LRNTKIKRFKWKIRDKSLRIHGKTLKKIGINHIYLKESVGGVLFVLTFRLNDGDESGEEFKFGQVGGW
jgi:hypothetical protein